MQDHQRQTLRMLLPNFNAGPELVVPRGKLPDELRAEVEASESVKLLVAGQRGMGKTTELRRLGGLLAGSDILPVFVQFGAQETITHPMLIQAMGRALQSAAPGKLSARISNRFDRWFAEEEEVIEVEEGREGSASFGGTLLVVKAGQGIRHKSTTRKTSKMAQPKSLGELIGVFNDLIKEGTRTAGRRVVFIVDDIDKIQDTGSIETTFIAGSHLIGAIGAPCVFTVPITYATSSSLRLTTLAYGQVYRVPAVEVVGESGESNTTEIAFMTEVLKRRMPYNPIPDPLLHAIVARSGGVHIDAMRLARGLIKRGILDTGAPMDDNALEEEFQTLVDDYRFVVDSRALWKSLVAMCGGGRGKAMLTDENLPALLYKMVVIEYRDKRSWFEVHPAARELFVQNAEVLKELV